MDWQTASWIAGAIGNAVTSIDKIYRGYADFAKDKKFPANAPPPDFTYQDIPEKKEFAAVSRRTGHVQLAVSYDDLCKRLNDDDRRYVEALDNAMRSYERAWTAAYEDRALASGMDRGRYDAQLERLSKDIADPLLKVLKFVEKMGLFLDDHFLAARDIAEKYLKEGK